MRRRKIEPLKKKLRRAGGKYPAAFTLFTNDFFDSLLEMSGNSRVIQDYWNYINPVISKLEREVRLDEFVSIINDMEVEEKRELMYQILVRPFAALKEENEKEEEGYGNDNASDYKGE